jgi:hypothetical protein
MLFLTSRQQREILVGDANDSGWLELTLPTRNTDVTAVAPDPGKLDRFYVSTLGEGIFIYEGKATKYITRKPEPAQAAGAVGAAGSK